MKENWHTKAFSSVNRNQLHLALTAAAMRARASHAASYLMRERVTELAFHSHTIAISPRADKIDESHWIPRSSGSGPATPVTLTAMLACEQSSGPNQRSA
jgi:hypothetical protein